MGDCQKQFSMRMDNTPEQNGHFRDFPKMTKIALEFFYSKKGGLKRSHRTLAQFLM